MQQTTQSVHSGDARVVPDGAPATVQRIGKSQEPNPTPAMRPPRRHHLYLWVWREPAIHIARELGISGAALRKRCLKFNIPMPGRGYWSQERVGVRLPVTPLPEPDDDPELPYAVSAQRFESLNSLPWPSLDRTVMLGENGGSDDTAALAQGKRKQNNQSEGSLAAHPRRVEASGRTDASQVRLGGPESNTLCDDEGIDDEPGADALSKSILAPERQVRAGLAQQQQLPSRMTARLQEQARNLRDIEQALQELAVETAAISGPR